ncbi:MAG: recombination mediator RecR [Proteobacteria bacterium]|nr:recombination mediator RecR [Pseudomonadota bacterium]
MSLDDLSNLIEIVSKLPGLGRRSGQKIALYLMQNKQLGISLCKILDKAILSVKSCENCGNLDVGNICSICSNSNRSRNLLCVVENVQDVWVLERSRLHDGVYHVLGGAISAIGGRGPDDLNIQKLIERIDKENIKEVIIATSATLDGESTGHYIADILEEKSIEITRIAHGIPMGAELDRMDDGTLRLALQMRKNWREEI